MPDHSTVRPARVKIHSTELATTVLRTFGYQAECACGWRGPIRSLHATARQDGREHNAKHRFREDT